MTQQTDAAPDIRELRRLHKLAIDKAMAKIAEGKQELKDLKELEEKAPSWIGEQLRSGRAHLGNFGRRVFPWRMAVTRANDGSSKKTTNGSETGGHNRSGAEQPSTT